MSLNQKIKKKKKRNETGVTVSLSAFFVYLLQSIDSFEHSNISSVTSFPLRSSVELVIRLCSNLVTKVNIYRAKTLQTQSSNF